MDEVYFDLYRGRKEVRAPLGYYALLGVFILYQEISEKFTFDLFSPFLKNQIILPIKHLKLFNHLVLIIVNVTVHIFLLLH